MAKHLEYWMILELTDKLLKFQMRQHVAFYVENFRWHMR